VNFDFSVVEKLNFDCVKGCGLCCAFRPQIGDFEINTIKRDTKLSKNYIEESNEMGEKEYYLKLQGARGNIGACVFLGRDRRCSIYTKRPFKCRMFPFYLRFGENVQVDADLACPGFWYPGGKKADIPAMESAKDTTLLSFEKIQNNASSNYKGTCTILKDSGLYVSRDDCRQGASNLFPTLCDLRGLESIFTMGAGDQFYSQFIINDLSAQLVESAFTGKSRPVDFPLFISPDMQWEFFARECSEIAVRRFGEGGEIVKVSRKPFKKPHLAPPRVASYNISKCSLTFYARVYSLSIPLRLILATGTGLSPQFSCLDLISGLG
jgi:Fe-S-cluster containining protein